MPEMLVVLLLATPLLAALACALPGFSAERAALSRAAALLILLFVFLLAAQATRPGTHLGLGGLVMADPATALTLLAVVMPAAAGTLLVPGQSARRSAMPAKEWATLHLLFAALLCAALSAHALLLWLSLVASVLLVGRLGTGKVAWRTLLPCALGLALALVALCLILPAGGDDWAALQHGATVSHGLARLSFVLALLGFGAVAGLVAPWSWLPGVGIARPAPAVPLVQVGLPVCALQAILRWAVLARHALGSAFPTHLLLATGLLGLVALLPALLVERDTRRMTALGGAAQVTMIAAAWGLNSQAAAGGGMLLLLCWSLAGSAALPVIASARDRQGGERFLRLGVLTARAPIPGAALLAALLTYGWWAPSGAFLALVAVLEAAMRQSIPIGLLLIVCAAVTMPALTRHATQLARGWRWRAPRRAGSAVARADQLAGSWPLLIPPAALLVLGVHVPDGLANLIVQAASTVGGGS